MYVKLQTESSRGGLKSDSGRKIHDKESYVISDVRDEKCTRTGRDVTVETTCIVT